MKLRLIPDYHKVLRLALTGLILVIAGAVHAQFRVDVAGVGMRQLPIAIAPFRGEDGTPQKLGSIVQADLERSGQFVGLPVVGVVLDELSRPDFTSWRQKGADSLLTGSVSRLIDGRFDVRFRLWDAVRGQDLGGQSYAATLADLRLVSHRISDFVYEKLTGEKGIFSTRIAYVTRTGARYQLWVADADGNRVLRFADISTKSNGANADRVLGQVSFLTDFSATTATGMNSPFSLSIDSAGRLWVADTGNHRILRFDNAASLPNGSPASGVLGQTLLTTSSSGTSANQFLDPYGVLAGPEFGVPTTA
jgi:hypothetical protein